MGDWSWLGVWSGSVLAAGAAFAAWLAWQARRGSRRPASASAEVTAFDEAKAAPPPEPALQPPPLRAHAAMSAEQATSPPLHPAPAGPLGTAGSAFFAARLAADAQAEALPGRRVLLVVGAPGERRRMAALLRAAGARVHEAAGGAQALAWRASPQGGDVDAVLIDDRVTRPLRHDLMARLKDAAGGDEPVLIGLGSPWGPAADGLASLDRLEALESLETDAWACVVMPPPPQELLQAVHSALVARDAVRTIARGLPRVDTRRLGEGALRLEVLRVAHRELERLLQALPAVQPQDAAVLAQMARRARGTALELGLHRLNTSADRLEATARAAAGAQAPDAGHLEGLRRQFASALALSCRALDQEIASVSGQ